MGEWAIRRREKAVAGRAEIEAIIRKATVCRVGLSDGDQPYVVPLCFGYRDNILYFHSAREGRKLDILRRNDKVCFEFDVGGEVVKSGDPCRWGMRYQSVIGFGRATFVEDAESKRRALEIIVNQYAAGAFSFPAEAIHTTAVIRVDIERMTGKQSGNI